MPPEIKQKIPGVIARAPNLQGMLPSSVLGGGEVLDYPALRTFYRGCALTNDF